jgi:hypothetical protein
MQTMQLAALQHKVYRTACLCTLRWDNIQQAAKLWAATVERALLDPDACC